MSFETADDLRRDERANEAQRRVLKLVREKKNVFYTGSAGTGKSFTTRLIIEAFRKPCQCQTVGAKQPFIRRANNQIRLTAGKVKGQSTG